MHSYREKVTPTHVLWETKGIKKTAPSFDKNEFENLYKLPAPVAGGGHIMVRGGVCWGGGEVIKFWMLKIKPSPNLNEIFLLKVNDVFRRKGRGLSAFQTTWTEQNHSELEGGIFRMLQRSDGNGGLFKGPPNLFSVWGNEWTSIGKKFLVTWSPPLRIPKGISVKKLSLIFFKLFIFLRS